MRTFEYRQPRLMTQYHVDFYVEGDVFHGTCTDVSDGGISARFDGPVLVGSRGEVTLQHNRHSFTMEAVVAHLEGDHAGLKFVCRTDEERLLSEQFVAAATGMHAL
jgi:hypothetical protein